MSDLDISIIIPVYGVEKYIDRFMRSLISQTIRNFVAVFIDDKTTDNSIRILAKYEMELHNRMVIISNALNKGLSASRNVGLDYVKEHPTKYVTFLDPDDWMESDYLENLYQEAELNNLDLCIAGLVRCDDNSGKILCKELITMPANVFEYPGDCKQLAYINPCCYSKLYRFLPIEDLRFRSIKRSEDTCFLFEALLRYKRIKFTNQARYHYCVRNSSLTGLINQEKYESMHVEFARLLPEFSDNYELYEMVVTQIFIRSSIGGVCRISLSDMKKAGKITHEEYNYLETNIPQWRINKYLKFGKPVIGDKKEFALRVASAMYKTNTFVLFIWAYYIMTRVLKKEVRA